VLAQRPKAGTRLPRGSKVSLVVSSGKPRKPRRR
jgi:beta-lactam-binding protein with PASTA domain